MKITDIIKISGEINRRDFLIWGIALFAIKYNLDRFLAMLAGRKWFFSEYWMQFDNTSGPYTDGDLKFYGFLIFLSLPFIWFGTLLTLKRLRNAALPGWLVICFFLPFINLLFFTILVTLPARSVLENKVVKKHPFLPASKFGSALASVIITSVVGVGFIVLLLEVMGDYGWSIFVGIPFILGFCAVIIFGQSRTIEMREALSVALSAVVTCSIFLFLIAFEGVICLAMAFPIGVLLSAMGAVLGYYLIRKRTVPTLQICLTPLLVILLLSYTEHHNPKVLPVFKVLTEIEIEAPKQEVWNQLLAFSTIEEPVDWLFKTGIAYPTHSEISGTGIGAIRECHFTTGPFVEPITHWEEPDYLAFSVRDQPPPMIEWSFGDAIEAAHLDGYFRSQKGSFELTSLPDGGTLLKGTTWYTNDIWPVGYWKLWTDFILHKIHMRVLNHIKTQAELEAN